MHNKKSKSAPRARETKLQKRVDELDERVTAFGLCLSAMLGIFGERTDQGFEYILHLDDFHRISESDVTVETAEFDGVPGTKVLVVTKKQNGS